MTVKSARNAFKIIINKLKLFDIKQNGTWATFKSFADIYGEQYKIFSPKLRQWVTYFIQLLIRFLGP